MPIQLWDGTRKIHSQLLDPLVSVAVPKHGEICSAQVLFLRMDLALLVDWRKCICLSFIYYVFQILWRLMDIADLGPLPILFISLVSIDMLLIAYGDLRDNTEGIDGWQQTVFFPFFFVCIKWGFEVTQPLILLIIELKVPVLCSFVLSFAWTLNARKHILNLISFGLYNRGRWSWICIIIIRLEHVW